VIEHFDVIVLGAGAAGLMCAIEAGKRDRRVALLERAEKIGMKILISGGGRCNFTNLHCKPENFLSANPHFAKSALARYTPQHFIELVKKYGIPFHEKTLGQLFCDGSAREIVAMLEEECRQAGVELVLNAKVESVEGGGEFRVLASGTEYRSSALVVATGGLSIPKIGATAFGYELARQFGLKIQECRPGLVPLLLGREDCRQYCDLTGVSAEVVASAGGHDFREKMLITHRGLSGPAILQISSYWRLGEAIEIDLAPGRLVTAALAAASAGRDLASAKTAFRGAMPQRLADRWVELHPPARWTNQGLAELERQTHHWQLMPGGTEGYEKAEVTAGGVDTGELSAKTMEARRVSGLFFVGEVVDVTGHLGGFNFQWAWASGWCAGQAV
jgi:predicted Rossmann fold flavoprotein